MCDDDRVERSWLIVGIVGLAAACARDNPAYDESRDDGTEATAGSATRTADDGATPTGADGDASDSNVVTGASDPSADSGHDATSDTGAAITTGSDATAGDSGIDLCLPGSGVVLDIPVTADTFLVDEVACGECADVNYGAADSHAIGRSKPYGDSVLLLRFDDAQPGLIGSALLELDLSVNGVVPGGALLRVDIFADSCDWQEGSGPAGPPDGATTYNNCEHPLVPWAGGTYTQEVSLPVASGPAPVTKGTAELGIMLDASLVEQWLRSSSRTLMVSIEPVGTATITAFTRESNLAPGLLLEYCP